MANPSTREGVSSSWTHRSAGQSIPVARCLNPFYIGTQLWEKRALIGEFILLELRARYRGLFLGMFWPIVQPILMLLVYTFVFLIIFRPRWDFGPGAGRVFHVLFLFCGLLIFNIFRECALKAAVQIRSHRNYVKKVVFPLEVFSVNVLGVALIHYAVSLSVFLLFVCWYQGVPSPHVLLLPLVLVPVCMLCLGLSWFLASAAVFVRDIAQGIQLIVQVSFFMTPVVYPITAVPEPVRSVLKLNPLAVCIEGARDLILFGRIMDWSGWLYAFVLSAVILSAGYAWFMHSKRLFLDFV